MRTSHTHTSNLHHALNMYLPGMVVSSDAVFRPLCDTLRAVDSDSCLLADLGFSPISFPICWCYFWL